MTVGITIKLYKGIGIFGNGLGQNCLMMYDLISKIPWIDKVHLVHFNNDLTLEDLKEIDFLDNYDVVKWRDDESEKIDLLIALGMFPDDLDLSRWKSENLNRRVVTYKGGNSMVLMTEDVIFHRKWLNRNEEDVQKGVVIRSNSVDQVWMVPQQEFHNKQFFEITYKVPVKTVPFVWSPKFIRQAFELKKLKAPTLEIEFDKKDLSFESWRIASMEPNQSVLKNMVPILYIIEHAYSKRPELFKQVNITNAKDFRDNPLLVELVSDLQIQKDGKIGFDPRWTVDSLISLFAEVIISHQWGNPLNYAYLDVVFFGYPLIHNAHLCKDIGYYYEDYNLKDAGDLLIKAMEERKQDAEYMQRNREILTRYRAEYNQAMVNQYGDLIKALWDGPQVNGEYNWKTNLIE